MVMKPDLSLSPAGLWTSPSYVEAPPGSLRVANEIAIRRKGRASPRPGFAVNATQPSNGPSRFLEYGSDAVLVEIGGKSRWLSSDGVIEDGNSNDLDWEPSAIQGVEIRKNLYLTTADGLRKLTAAQASNALRTGAPTPAVFASTDGAGDALNALSRVSYRAVTLRRDANEVVVRSAPSNRALLQNDTGSAVKVELVVALHENDDFQAGDALEIYRSINTNSTTVLPFDDHYLIITYVLTSTDVSNGYVILSDDISDTEMEGGVSLYTNSDLGGLASANTRPPQARCCALFNGSLFLGNLTYPAEEIYTYGITSSPSTSAGIGMRSASCGMTNGSGTITVPDSSILKVGMLAFSDAGSDWAAGSAYPRITAINNGTTVTVNRNWASTTANHIISFVDSMRIGSNYYPAGFGGLGLVFAIRGQISHMYPQFGPLDQGPDASVTAELLSSEFGAAANVAGLRVVRIQALRPDTTPPLVYATHGADFTPDLTEPGGAGTALPQDILPNAVAWSLNQQPEHFTLENFEQIGHELHRVMALSPLKKCLLICKSDSLHRASGSGAESGFRFDNHDPDVRLLFPEAACVLFDKCYLWGDAGVFECDEDGVLNVSDPAIQDLLNPVQAQIQAGSTSAYGAWAVANRKNHEFVLSVPDLSPVGYGERLYVFNQQTGAWTNWLVGTDLWGGYYRNTDGKIYLFDGTNLRRELPAGSHYDASYSVTINSFVGTEVVIAAASGWTPAVGDILIRSGTTMRVMEVASATAFTTDVAPPSTGAADARVAFTSEIEFIAQTNKNPGALKLWGEGSVWFEEVEGLWRYTMSFTSSLSDTAVEVEVTMADAPLDEPNAEAYRFATPQNHSRTTRLYPRLTIRAGDADWALSAIAVNARVMSNRVRAR